MYPVKLLSIEMYKIIIEEIEQINNDYGVTHFEFVSNPTNWPKIEAFLKEKGFDTQNLSGDEDAQLKENFEDLLSKLFWLDFNKILQASFDENKKHTPLYNIKLLKKEVESIFRESKEGKTTQKNYVYVLDLHTTVYFHFSHNSESGENNKLELKMNYKHCIEEFNKETMCRAEVNIFNHLFSTFLSKNKVIEINKQNLKNMLDYFIFDINRHNLTTGHILHYNDLLNKDETNKTAFLLSKPYSNNYINVSFHPKNIPGHNIEHNRVFYDPYLAFGHCISNDINHAFMTEKYPETNIEIERKFNWIKISIIENFETRKKFARYYLELKNKKLAFYIRDKKVKEWDDISIIPCIKDKVISLIRDDVSGILERNKKLEKVIHERCLADLHEYFKDINIDISLAPLSSLSIEDLNTCEISVFISCNNEIFEKKIVAVKEGLQKNMDLYLFREKIKIMSVLKDSLSSESKKEKRRL